MSKLPTTTLNGKTYVIDEKRCELRNARDAKDVLKFGSYSDLREYQFWTEQLQFIVGRKVTRAEMVDDDTLYGWVPVITFDDGTKLEMLQDEEGNGPGRFSFRD